MNKKLLYIVFAGTSTFFTAPLQAVKDIERAIENNEYEYTRSDGSEGTLDLSNRGITKLDYWKILKKFRKLDVLDLSNNSISHLPTDFIWYIFNHHIIVYLYGNDFTPEDLDNYFYGNKAQCKMWFIRGLPDPNMEE